MYYEKVCGVDNGTVRECVVCESERRVLRLGLVKCVGCKMVCVWERWVGM